MVSLPIVMLPGNTGQFVIVPGTGIITEPAVVGTAFVLQFAGVFQSVLALPSQVCAFTNGENIKLQITTRKIFLFITNIFLNR
jgi:hypothetical protein